MLLPSSITAAAAYAAADDDVVDDDDDSVFEMDLTMQRKVSATSSPLASSKYGTAAAAGDGDGVGVGVGGAAAAADLHEVHESDIELNVLTEPAAAAAGAAEAAAAATAAVDDDSASRLSISSNLVLRYGQTMGNSR